jgi:hypothetical protein
VAVSGPAPGEAIAQHPVQVAIITVPRAGVSKRELLKSLIITLSLVAPQAPAVKSIQIRQPLEIPS